MQDRILDQNCDAALRRNTGSDDPLANVVDAALQPPIADEIEFRARRAKRQFRRFIPALRENRFDDVHSNSSDSLPGWPIGTSKKRLLNYCFSAVTPSAQASLRVRPAVV